MRNPQGYAIWTGDGSSQTIERDTFTCVHCGNIVFVEPLKPPEDAGGWCIRCSQPICKTCAGRGVCDPFEKKLQRAEARDRFLRSAGL